MDKVNYAVIGLGWFGEKHCEAIAGIPNAELVVLCTRNPARLNEVADRFGVKHAYIDYHESSRSRSLATVARIGSV